MAAQRYEISLQVFKNISEVSAQQKRKIFQHSKGNFSPNWRVMFCLLHKHWSMKYQTISI